MKANLIFFLAIFIVSALFIGHFRLTFSPFSVSFPYWHRTVGVILIVAGCLVYNIGEHMSGSFVLLEVLSQNLGNKPIGQMIDMFGIRYVGNIYDSPELLK